MTLDKRTPLHVAAWSGSKAGPMALEISYAFSLRLENVTSSALTNALSSQMRSVHVRSHAAQLCVTDRALLSPARLWAGTHIEAGRFG